MSFCLKKTIRWYWFYQKPPSLYLTKWRRKGKKKKSAFMPLLLWDLGCFTIRINIFLFWVSLQILDELISIMLCYAISFGNAPCLLAPCLKASKQYSHVSTVLHSGQQKEKTFIHSLGLDKYSCISARTCELNSNRKFWRKCCRRISVTQWQIVLNQVSLFFILLLDWLHFLF